MTNTKADEQTNMEPTFVTRFFYQKPITPGCKIKRDGKTTGAYHILDANGRPLCGARGEYARTLPLLPPL